MSRAALEAQLACFAARVNSERASARPRFSMFAFRCAEEPLLFKSDLNQQQLQRPAVNGLCVCLCVCVGGGVLNPTYRLNFGFHIRSKLKQVLFP